MASFLTIVFVICALVSFGVFFLIFKLIWLLCKKKRNFWPLVLSGSCTALLLVVLTVATYQAYKHFSEPFQPIIAALSSKQPPQYGTQTFTDPQQRFSLVTHDGVVMSRWIDFSPEAQFLVGLDVNPIRQSGKTSPERLSGVLLARQQQNDFSSAEQFFREVFFPTLNHNEDARNAIDIKEGPTSILVGDGASAAYVRGTLHSEKTPTLVPAVFLVAMRGTDTYYIVGVGSQAAEDTATSFRFLP